ncbi:MAG: hypothetical protein H8D67_02660 [Deltaproteobacteria bacterium]|nr:hypothetical protein [Deltaproteobacteria bacterium]
MNQTERLKWQARVEFYGKKIEQYKIKFPNRLASRRTIRRWKNEFEKTENV